MPLPRGPPKLPVQQFSILGTCRIASYFVHARKADFLCTVALVRFSEPIALTSVYPYLPAMIQSFPRVKDADVGFWTGTASAIFSLAQCLTAISWGKASDRYGRKPIILLGLFNTMLTSLLWGFSTNLPMALFSRALSGAGNGNIGIIRTMVAELCPWKVRRNPVHSKSELNVVIGATASRLQYHALGIQRWKCLGTVYRWCSRESIPSRSPRPV